MNNSLVLGPHHGTSDIGEEIGKMAEEGLQESVR